MFTRLFNKYFNLNKFFSSAINRKLTNYVKGESFKELAQDIVYKHVAVNVDARIVADKVAIEIKDNMLGEEDCYESLASHVDLYDLAQQVDCQDIASYVDTDDVAGSLDTDDISSSIANEIVDEVVSKVTENVLEKLSDAFAAIR